MISCSDRARSGVLSQRVQQELLIQHNGPPLCSCKKPSLLHLPCSHLIAACSVAGLQPSAYVSPYFTKDAAVITWSNEVYSVEIFGPFTLDRHPKMYIPDEGAKRGKGRRQTRRIRNAMDESEAGKAPKQCNQCGQSGHTYRMTGSSSMTITFSIAMRCENSADQRPPGFPCAGPGAF